MTEHPDAPAARRRLRACVEAWPECSTGEYDPHCCRFPKSCSCTVYDDEYVTEADLEPRPDPPAASVPETPVALRPDGRYPDCTSDCGERGMYCCNGGWDSTRDHTQREDGVWMPLAASNRRVLFVRKDFALWLWGIGLHRLSLRVCRDV